MRPVLELAQLPFRLVADSGRVYVTRPRGIGTAVLDARARTLTTTRAAQLPDTSAAVIAGEIHASPSALGALLEGAVVPNLGALVLTVSRDPLFPAQERLALAASRRIALARAGGGPGGPEQVPFIPRSGAGVLEWGVASDYTDGAATPSVYARLGVGVYGGMAHVGGALSPGGEGAPDVHASYQRVFPHQRWVRQVSVGDIVTGGITARSVRGVAITNAPFVRNPLFGTTQFAPRLPSGWEYEAYQQGRLIGYSRGDAPVSVPLQYGSTPVEVRLYGPAGERIRSELAYFIPVGQLPAGEFQYAAGAGQCPGDDCRLFSYGEARYGLSAAATVLGGADLTTDSAGSRVRPYAGATLLAGRSWLAEVQAILSSRVTASVERYGTGRVTGRASAGLVYPENPGIIQTGQGEFSPTEARESAWYSDLLLHLRPGRIRALDLRGRVDGSGGAGLDRVQLAAATSLRRVYLEAGYESSRDFPALYLLRGSLPLPRIGRAFGAPALSGTVATDGSGLNRWEATLAVQPRGAIVSVTARQGTPGASPSVQIGATFRTGAGLAQTRVGVQDGAALGGASLSGVATFGSQAGLRVLPYGGVGHAGISGTVFHDLNGNGRFDQGDEAVDRASVDVGGVQVRTDSTGRYRTWSVLPYEILRVALDTVSLDDPSWVPAAPEVFLRANPHLYTVVDHPLVRTRELAGQLEAGPEVASSAGVTVEVVNVASNEVLRALTFSDGAFYLGRIRPGEYEIRVAESSLRALRARIAGAPPRVTIAAAGADPLVEVPTIRLVRATGP